MRFSFGLFLQREIMIKKAAIYCKYMYNVAVLIDL